MASPSSIASDYLSSGQLLQLATDSGGQPWLSQVWYAFDPATWTVVFTSNLARRHSNEIGANAKVAGAVMAQPLEGLGQKVQGICFEGRAREATGDELATSYEIYAGRWPRVRSMFSADDILHEATPMRMYNVSLTQVVLFDEVNFPESPRQEFAPTH